MVRAIVDCAASLLAGSYAAIPSPVFLGDWTRLRHPVELVGRMARHTRLTNSWPVIWPASLSLFCQGRCRLMETGQGCKQIVVYNTKLFVYPIAYHKSCPIVYCTGEQY